MECLKRNRTPGHGLLIASWSSFFRPDARRRTEATEVATGRPSGSLGVCVEKRRARAPREDPQWPAVVGSSWTGWGEARQEYSRPGRPGETRVQSPRQRIVISRLSPMFARARSRALPVILDETPSAT